MKQPIQWLFVMTVLADPLAGCASPAAPAVTDTTSTAPVVARYDLLPSAAPALGERTLEQAPTWRLGEWWTYRVLDQFTGRTFNATRVVGGTLGSDYMVGFPVDAFSNDILVLHLPGVGDVAMADLSFEVHDVRFHPLQFPLAPGDSWATSFEGRNGTMQVEATQGGVAQITGLGAGWSMNLTYDAAVGEVTHLEYPGYMTFDITAHGFGYNGTIRMPHAHDLIFQHGRIAGPLGPDLAPRSDAPVSETVRVQPGYDRLSFVIVVGNALAGSAPATGAPAPAAGYYHEKATSPDGTVYELTALPHEQALKIQFYGAGDPTGTWHLEHTAAGPGLAFIEGIGYHSVDVRLPEGCTMAGSNAAHHGKLCL